MPGILGFTIRQDEAAQAAGDGARMQAMLRHFQTHVAEPLFADGRIVAARVGNGIVQRQAQPAVGPGVRVWLHGEFYNHDRIDRLRCAGSQGDAGVLRDLYLADRGLGFLNDIDGVYSAVIYDEAAGKLVLLIDRYGLQHLYWTVHRGQLAWASEYKAMLALPGFAPRIDPETLEDYFGIGYPTGDRTWFRGVEVLPAGAVLTWDIASAKMNKRRYWFWTDIQPMAHVDTPAVAEELGRRFVDAVRRRVNEGERVGVTLSGGLDSRAVLAAVPDSVRPLHAITFGKPDSPDVRIARRAARLKGAVHHVYCLSAKNWLQPRLDGVWWTDGQDNVLDMHRLTFLAAEQPLFNINLCGFLGDATIGGSYLNDPAHDEIWKFDNRGRRYIMTGTLMVQAVAWMRMPFFDNAFMDLAISVPPNMRAKSAMYNKMLLRTFPQYFLNLPWQKTGLPIDWNERPGVRHFMRRCGIIGRDLTRQMGLKWFPLRRDFYDYRRWILQEPARSFFRQILLAPDAIYPQYVSPDRVREDLALHEQGQDLSEKLCHYLSFEIWLQQAFAGRFRPPCRENPAQAGPSPEGFPHG